MSHYHSWEIIGRGRYRPYRFALTYYLDYAVVWGLNEGYRLHTSFILSMHYKTALRDLPTFFVSSYFILGFGTCHIGTVTFSYYRYYIIWRCYRVIQHACWILKHIFLTSFWLLDSWACLVLDGWLHGHFTRQQSFGSLWNTLKLKAL